MNTALRAEAIEEGLIDEDIHSQLLVDIEGYTRTAGIPERFVWTSLSEFCGDEETQYVNGIKESLTNHDGECIGMVYIGKVKGASINDRMMSIAGVCLRNYINAKVMTVQDVLSAMKSESMPGNVSVLLIPNFFIGKGSGGHIPDWQVSNLLGMLYKRQQEGKHTILYVSDMEGLDSEYGEAFQQHIHGKFVPIT